MHPDFPLLLEQVSALDAGEVTSVELTTRALDAAEASQGSLRAFALLRREQALAEAEAADRRRAEGHTGGLLGVPLAVKDDTDVEGHPTAFGCVGDFPTSTQDAELTRTLRGAGAVIIGKTATCEFGQWPVTGSLSRGYTRSPWGRDVTPGGSSGGAATAVAAGVLAAAIGSDGAGSVRIPASWTHLVGIKPQRGRISTYPWTEAFGGLTVNGPLAHTVADAAYLLEHTQGQHRDDQHRPGRVEAYAASQREPGALRVGVSLKPPFSGFPARLDPQIESRVQAMADHLAGLGHRVALREPGYRLWQGLGFLTYSMTGLHQWRGVVDDDARLDPRTLGNARNGVALSRLMPMAKRMERRLASAIAPAFDEVDVFLAPTTAQPPLSVDAIDQTSHVQTDRTIIAACPYTWPWNVLGWPSINIPAGFTTSGLPVGVQLMGPQGSEERLISLAAQLEAAGAWERRHPERWWV